MTLTLFIVQFYSEFCNAEVAIGKNDFFDAPPPSIHFHKFCKEKISFVWTITNLVTPKAIWNAFENNG